MNCPRCGSPTREVLTPDLPHHGKLVCTGAAEHFVKWLARPQGGDEPPVVDRRPFEPPAILVLGTPDQRVSAESIRATMLRRCRVARLYRTAAVIGAVIDATWFLANRDRELDELRWPAPRQLEQPAAEPRR